VKTVHRKHVAVDTLCTAFTRLAPAPDLTSRCSAGRFEIMATVRRFVVVCTGVDGVPAEWLKGRGFYGFG